MKKREKYTVAEKAQLKKGTRKNFTTGERHKMCLSQETLEGLRMTGIIIANYKVYTFLCTLQPTPSFKWHGTY